MVSFPGYSSEAGSWRWRKSLVMHPGPMNRGVEIASSVADCGQSVITQQVESGVAVRMALLYMLTRRENV